MVDILGLYYREFYARPSAAIPVAPTYVNGSVLSDVAGFAVTLPASIATNDILILAVETANQAVSITNSAGGTWTEVTGSPIGTGTAGAAVATRVTVFWSRYNGTQTAPTISDSGDHQLAIMTAWRGCPTAIDPFDGTPAGTTDNTADNQSVTSAITTTQKNSLVVHHVALDLETTGVSSWSNGNLTGLAENIQGSSAAGNDGRLEVASGVKVEPGDTGATTATLSDSLAIDAHFTFALKGV